MKKCLLFMLVMVFAMFAIFTGGQTDKVYAGAAESFHTGNALHYADTDDTIYSTNSLTYQTDNITMEAWVKADTLSGAHTNIRIMYNGDSGSTGYGIYLSGPNKNPCILIGGRFFIYMKTPVTLNTGQWYHLAAVRDSGTWKLYINGEEKELDHHKDIAPYNIDDSDGDPDGFSIGNNDSVPESFTGCIDEVRFWTKVRTQDEIKENMYIKLQGNESGLLAYYNFDQAGIKPGEDNTGIASITDVAGGDNNLTISGFALNGGTSNFISSVQLGQFQFENATYTVKENAGSVKLAITRTLGSQGSVTINYETANGTAIAGTNYTETKGSVTFAEGEVKKEIVVPITDNSSGGADKTFTMTLSAENGVKIAAPTSATVTIQPSDAKAITGFKFNGLTPAVNGTVNEAEKKIALTVPHGTDVTALVPTITHTGASVSPNNGVAKSFTTPVTYTVTAADGTTQDYSVTVTVEAAITAFDFNGLTPVVTGTVNQAAKTIVLTVPYGTDVTALVPTITHTGAGVSPNSGAAQNFTNAVTYTLTAKDGTTQDYSVTVNVAADPAKAISAFNFNGLTPIVKGTVDEGEKKIALTVPFGTDVTTLVPTITHSGASVSPNSGAAQNFTNAVTYTVTAADGTTQGYEVTVTVEAAITAFDFNGLTPAVTGTMNEDEKKIALTVPFGTDVTALVPTITHAGASVSPKSGVAQDFTNPVTYTVTAASGITQAYSVTVTVAANTAKAITAFDFNGLTPAVKGTVNEGEKKVALTVPQGTDVTALVPNITHTGASVSPNSGVAQDFTNPVTYTVTAADGSTQAYSVTVTVTAPASSGSDDTSSSSADNKVISVIVNGTPENAGTASTDTRNGQTVTTITVDSQQLEGKLQNEENGAVVALVTNSNSDRTNAQLTGQMVKTMEDREAVICVKTGGTSYTVPAGEININAVSEQLDQGIQLSDINVNIDIAEPPADTVKIVEDTANKNNYQIVVKPVDFCITCTYGGKTVEVSEFNGYVERTIAIPDNIEPEKITTGVVLNPDGTFRHVPTTIVVINRKYYAKINSLTNSIYSVIYNPIEFNDVADHWAKHELNDLASRMVISADADGNYSPYRQVTRAECAEIIIKALGIQPKAGKNVFNDVEPNDPYSPYIDTAYEYGIVSGVGKGRFAPLAIVSREQVIAMMANAMKVSDIKVELTEGEKERLLAQYKDGTEVSEWAEASLAQCIKLGIVSGKGNMTLAPKDNTTRAEMAVFVRRLLVKSGLI